jgi:hypothetical protein
MRCFISIFPSMAWMTDMRHYLDNEGTIPEDIPKAALRLAEYFGSVVTFASALITEDELNSTPVACRRRPGRKPCAGKIRVDFRDPDFAILWECPLCKDGGVIAGWKETQWDCSREIGTSD